MAVLFNISVVIKSQSTGSVSDKVKNRLEQLDDFEEVFFQEIVNSIENSA